MGTERWPSLLAIALIILCLFHIGAGELRNCQTSITTVWGQLVCKGKVIFEDNFDNLDRWKWKSIVKMAGIREDEFVTYDKKPQNAFVRDGKLFIKPEVLDEKLVTKGSMMLSECTGPPSTMECRRDANAYNIIPPVRSAKITTQDSLSFRYGIVEVRAKLSSGDWLIPQIILDPSYEEYGSFFKSGRIRIAKIHGNRELWTLDPAHSHIGSRLLTSSLFVGGWPYYKGNGIKLHNYNNTPWTDDFHLFRLIWLPDKILFSVDGSENYDILPEISTNLIDALKVEEDQDNWLNGSTIAPFDKEFYLSLSLSAGKSTEYVNWFDDLRPWSRKGNAKALLNFWQDRVNWQNTWIGDETAMQVDFVRITAL